MFKNKKKRVKVEINNLSKQKNNIRIVLTILVICGMVLASELLNDKEIIFPEIAAIAVGSFISPQFAWNTSKFRMIAGIMICAFLGVGIVCFAPGPLFLQIALAYFLGRIVLMAMKVTFAPMISAIVLPVLLQTESIVYLVSAFVLTFSIVMIRAALERTNMVKTREYKKSDIDLKKGMFQIAVTTAFVCFLAWACILLGFKFMIAPPLLVVFTEFANPKSKGRQRPIATTLVIAGCALAGSLSRFILTMTLGLPLTVAALVGCILMFVVLKASNVFLPPTGALMVLAMLIPEAAVVLFPLQVLTGCAVMVLFDMLVFRKKEIAHSAECHASYEATHKLQSI